MTVKDRLLNLVDRLDAFHTGVEEEDLKVLRAAIINIDATDELVKAVNKYMHDHDHYGSSDPMTGRSWMLMRRAVNNVKDTQ